MRVYTYRENCQNHMYVVHCMCMRRDECVYTDERINKVIAESCI